MSQHQHTKQVVSRLSRIEGHVRAVKAMVSQERSCDEVLVQMAAIRAAVNRAAELLLTDHLEHCIVHDVQEGRGAKSLAELRHALRIYLK